MDSKKLSYDKRVSEDLSRDFAYLNRFDVLRLKEGEQVGIPGEGKEAALVVFEGIANIRDGKTTYPIRRKDLFEDPAQALYHPRLLEGSVEAATDLHLGIIYGTQEGPENSHPELINEPKEIEVGRDNWQRTVRLIVPPNGFSKGLVIGETVNPAGNWSGTPSHRHDRSSGVESVHEELYYFLGQRPGAWGIQRNYNENGVEKLIKLGDNMITLTPSGYHQIVAGPGHPLYYLFCIGGEDNALRANKDEAQTFVEDKK